MSDFAYISVLLSIILGLGIAQLLAGIARLVRDGRRLWPAWWVMVMVAMLLLAHFQVWWVSFHWRHVQSWTFLSYIAFMTLPMLLYLLAYLILPADLRLDGRALAQEFIGRRRPFYAILALIPPASFFQQHLFGAAIPLDFDTGARIFWFVLAVPGFLSRRILVQAVVAVTYLALMVAYITLLFTHLH